MTYRLAYRKTWEVWLLQDIIRVIVVDDSSLMLKIISDVLESSGDIRVIATAKNGVEAIKAARDLNPDVITLDVEMPVMDGLTCLRELNRVSDARVIMLSAFTKEGADLTIDALESGAVDFITKPEGIFDISGPEKIKEIIDKVRIAKVIRKRNRITSDTGISKKYKTTTRNNYLKYIIAIGASTGGPEALKKVLTAIPGDIPAAVLIVQHMPPKFTRSLAERLNLYSELTVKEASDGDVVTPGTAYIAPGDFHMLVSGNQDSGLKIVLTKDPPELGLRPSVNAMMNSLARTGFPGVIGVILTGMGTDGAIGIRNLKACNNGFIISQDEKSCVVYGMPKAAVNTGVVDSIVPLEKIADEILRNMR